MYNSMVGSVFAELCSCCNNLIVEHFLHIKKKTSRPLAVTPHSLSPFPCPWKPQIYFLSLEICLIWTLKYQKSYQTWTWGGSRELPVRLLFESTLLWRSLCLVDSVMEIWALKLPLHLPESLAYRGAGRWKSHPSALKVGAWWATRQDTSNTELSLVPPTLLGAAMHWPGIWKQQAVQHSPWPQGAFHPCLTFLILKFS